MNNKDYIQSQLQTPKFFFRQEYLKTVNTNFHKTWLKAVSYLLAEVKAILTQGD